MRRTILAVASGLCLLAIQVHAQGPPAQRQGPGPGQQPMTVQQIVPVEGVIGFLCFQQELTDEQFLGAREVLTEVFDGREALLTKMQAGTIEQAEIRDTVFALRSQMTDDLTEILNDAQDQQLLQALGMQPPPGAPPGAANGG